LRPIGKLEEILAARGAAIDLGEADQEVMRWIGIASIISRHPQIAVRIEGQIGTGICHGVPRTVPIYERRVIAGGRNAVLARGITTRVGEGEDPARVRGGAGSIGYVVGGGRDIKVLRSGLHRYPAGSVGQYQRGDEGRIGNV
jgi:hypothetical protein